ncbi:MAG: adenylyl-sulfate kinase [Betaproteobacteria bacterium]|nr:adenylyl-sulfate kinase [Betaproteobacteria bacterium]
MPEPPADLERLPFLKLTPRQQCDVEMLLTGAYSPLEGFLGRDDYLAVLQTCRLADGTLWPIPATLDITHDTLAALGGADRLLLLDAELYPVAVLEAGEIWQPDRAQEARILYGTDDPTHPGVAFLLHDTAPYYLSGRLRGIRLPVCRFQADFRLPPAAMRALLAQAGSAHGMAFWPETPADLAALQHASAIPRAGNLLLFFSASGAVPAVVPGRTLALNLAAALPRLNAAQRVSYCNLPLWRRPAGGRDLVLRAIVSQNYGASHFRVPVTGDSLSADGAAEKTGWQQAQALLLKHARRELEIAFVNVPQAVAPKTGVSSATPEIDALFHHGGSSRGSGFALFLTGLSGAGKSSLAHALAETLECRYRRAVTVLDGDYSRQLLTSDLTAAPEHQRLNVLRHAFIASEITRHGGIAVCALVAPDAQARLEARRLVERAGRFIEIHVAAPVAVCAARDRKGIYSRTKAGLLGAIGMHGEDYAVPSGPEIVADSARDDVATLTQQVIDYLMAHALLDRS